MELLVITTSSNVFYVYFNMQKIRRIDGIANGLTRKTFIHSSSYALNEIVSDKCISYVIQNAKD